MMSCVKFIIIGISGIKNIGKFKYAKYLNKSLKSPCDVIKFVPPSIEIEKYNKEFVKNIKILQVSLTKHYSEYAEFKKKSLFNNMKNTVLPSNGISPRINKETKICHIIIKGKNLFLDRSICSIFDSCILFVPPASHKFSREEEFEEFEKLRKVEEDNIKKLQEQKLLSVCFETADEKYYPPMSSILNYVKYKKIIFVGIGGGSCSGKTTIGRLVSIKLNSPVRMIGQDFYFLPKEKIPKHPIYQWNYEVPEAVRFDELLRDMKKIRNNFEFPEFFVNVENSSRNRVAPVSCNLRVLENLNYVFIFVEGFLLYLREDISDFFDIKLWFEAPREVCKERRVNRGKRRTRKNTRDIGKWFDDEIWKYYLKFRDTQLKNGGKNLLKFDGTEKIPQLVDLCTKAILQEAKKIVNDRGNSNSVRFHGIDF